MRFGSGSDAELLRNFVYWLPDPLGIDRTSPTQSLFGMFCDHEYICWCTILHTSHGNTRPLLRCLSSKRKNPIWCFEWMEMDPKALHRWRLSCNLLLKLRRRCRLTDCNISSLFSHTSSRKVASRRHGTSACNQGNVWLSVPICRRPSCCHRSSVGTSFRCHSVPQAQISTRNN